MSYLESAFVFVSRGQSLPAILAAPEAARNTGVLLVVGGPQYRVGSHRQFVLLSRALAAAGAGCADVLCHGPAGKLPV